MKCGILDLIPEQKEASNGKAAEIQIKGWSLVNSNVSMSVS